MISLTTAPANTNTNRILVCAPSNAAVDELARRMQRGVRSTSGSMYLPKIVRLGTVEGVSESVIGLTLDHLVDQRLLSDAKTKDLVEKHMPASLKTQLAHVDAQLNSLKSAKGASATIEHELQVLASQRHAIMREIMAEVQAKEYKKLEGFRTQLRTQILVCTGKC